MTATVVTAVSPHRHPAADLRHAPAPRFGAEPPRVSTEAPRVSAGAPSARTVTVHLTLHGDASDVVAVLNDLAPHVTLVNYTLVPEFEPHSVPPPAVAGVTVAGAPAAGALRGGAAAGSTARGADPDLVVLDTAGRTVSRGGIEIVLCRREFDLLLFLATHPGQVFTREQLLNAVWGDAFSGPRTVDVHVTRLRRKLATSRPVVATVRGVGYRLETRAPVRVVSSVRRTAGRRMPPPHARTVAA